MKLAFTSVNPLISRDFSKWTRRESNQSISKPKALILKAYFTLRPFYKTTLLGFHNIIQSLDEVGTLKPGIVPNNSNLNNVSSTGLKSNSIYALNGDFSYQNIPTGVKWGILEVISTQTASFILERITTHNRVYTRIYANKKWHDWF